MEPCMCGDPACRRCYPGGDPDDKPTCKLTGTDGNVFSIIGQVSKALKGAGQPEDAAEFCTRAMKAGSYDAVLALCFEYVNVE